MNRNKINITEIIDKKFNKLKVVSFVKKIKKTNSYNYYYKCLCDCGNYTITLRNHLLTNHTKSCGCLKHHTGKYLRKKFGINSMNSLYYQYKAGAKQRNQKFTLIKQQFEEITKQNCYKEFNQVFCPETEYNASKLLSLPMYPELTEEEVRYVIDCLEKILKKE